MWPSLLQEAADTQIVITGWYLDVITAWENAEYEDFSMW